MNKIILKRLGVSVIMAFFSLYSWAQATSDSAPPSVDEAMRSHNKIYVVMAVCLVILLALFLYLVRIDRKVSKKEKLM